MVGGIAAVAVAEGTGAVGIAGTVGIAVVVLAVLGETLWGTNIPEGCGDFLGVVKVDEVDFWKREGDLGAAGTPANIEEADGCGG